MIKAPILLGMLVCALSAAPVAAQGEPATAQAAPSAPAFRTTGLVLGFGLTGAAATFEGGDHTTQGVGVGVRAGYGLGRFALVAGAAAERMDIGTYTLAQLDLGGRYLFSDARLRPYVQGAWSARVARKTLAGWVQRTIEVRSLGPSVGAGAEYGMSPRVAVDVGLLYTGGRYTHGHVTGEPWEDLGADAYDGRSLRLDVGVVVRP
jgi:opacity protein-like surface antigen